MVSLFKQFRKYASPHQEDMLPKLLQMGWKPNHRNVAVKKSGPEDGAAFYFVFDGDDHSAPNEGVLFPDGVFKQATGQVATGAVELDPNLWEAATKATAPRKSTTKRENHDLEDDDLPY